MSRVLCAPAFRDRGLLACVMYRISPPMIELRRWHWLWYFELPMEGR